MLVLEGPATSGQARLAVDGGQLRQLGLQNRVERAHGFLYQLPGGGVPRETTAGRPDSDPSYKVAAVPMFHVEHQAPVRSCGPRRHLDEGSPALGVNLGHPFDGCPGHGQDEDSAPGTDQSASEREPHLRRERRTRGRHVEPLRWVAGQLISQLFDTTSLHAGHARRASARGRLFAGRRPSWQSARTAESPGRGEARREVTPAGHRRCPRQSAAPGRRVASPVRRRPDSAQPPPSPFDFAPVKLMLWFQRIRRSANWSNKAVCAGCGAKTPFGR